VHGFWFKTLQLRFLLYLVACVLLCGLGRASSLTPISVAFAQENEGQSGAAAQNLTLFIETQARQKLSALINSVVSKRLHPSKFAVEVTPEADSTKVATISRGWGEDNTALLRGELRRYDYYDLRDLLGTVTIRLRYTDTITPSEWQIIEDELRAMLARGGDVFEQIESSADKMSPDLSESLILLRAREQRQQLEEEYRLKTTLEEARSQLRQRELQREFELRRELNDQEKAALQSELQNERQKRFELADVLAKDFNINDYLVRQFPVLSRFAAVGSGVGALAIIGLLVLGLLLIVAAGTLGKHLKTGVHEIALALKGDSKSESDLKALGGQKGPLAGAEEKQEPDSVLEFEHKPQLKEAAEKLRSQVERDTQTTAVVLSKVAEEEKFGEVIAIFDILGPDLARVVFNQFTSMAKKSLQRAFYESDIKRPNISALFNRINELRAMLATTDVMMADESDKEFAQIILAYPDSEIASALVKIPILEAVSLLSRLPAERMLSIIRSFPIEVAEAARAGLGRTIRKGIDASIGSIQSFVGSIMDEARLRFEENKRFLKGVIDVASEEEAEAIISGMNFDPRLLLEVIGIRATMEDLWAQSVETIETLFSGLELESVVGVLSAAPEAKQNEVIASFPERKQLLSRDIMDNLSSNADYNEKIKKKVEPERKKILAKLGDLAKAGSVVLPSYERLKAEVARQEELEKEGKNYEDHLEALRDAG
jgi:hypothetical protein